jgi:hypothetical protein
MSERNPEQQQGAQPALSKEDQSVFDWAGDLMKDAGKSISAKIDQFTGKVKKGAIEAVGGNASKIEQGGAPDGKLQRMKITFPVFPSAAFVKELQSKYDPETEPLAKAIADGMPLVSFVLSYDTPRELAEKVSDAVARDEVMNFLSPEFRKVEYTIASVIANRQKSYDGDDDIAFKQQLLQDAGKTALELVEGYVEPACKTYEKMAADQLTLIYKQYGENVDSACVANRSFTYTIVASTIKMTAAFAALAATPVTFGATGIAGVLGAVDATAKLASAITQRLTTMELVEQALKGELDSLIHAVGGSAQGLKDLIITTALQGASIAGFGVSGIRALVADLVTVGSGAGPLGQAFKAKFDLVTITTSDVEKRLEFLKAKSGAVAMESNGFLNELNKLLADQDKSGSANKKLEDEIDAQIKRVIELNERCVKVQASINASAKRLEEFTKKLGGWDKARKFVDMAGAIISLGQSFDKVAEMGSWDELQKALDPKELAETVTKVLEFGENSDEAVATVKELAAVG